MNISQDLAKLFDRDLEKLGEELNAYHHEDDIWILDGSIKNTAGNLAMHICGNLQHFIGAVLADTGYERNKAFEFEGKMTRVEILEEVRETRNVIASFFKDVDMSTYESTYPLEVFGYKMTTFFFITHLQGHLNYHLGQVNYHRRLLSK